MRAGSSILLLTNINLGTEQIEMKNMYIRFYMHFQLNLKLFLKPQVVKKAHLAF